MEENKLPEEDKTFYRDIGMMMCTGFGEVAKIICEARARKKASEKLKEEKPVLNNDTAIPSVDEAGAIAVKALENVEPKLTTQEQAFFIAGFQECIKYLKLNDTVVEDKNMSTVYFDKQVLNPHAQGTQAYTNWEQGFMEAANKYFKPYLNTNDTLGQEQKEQLDIHKNFCAPQPTNDAFWNDELVGQFACDLRNNKEVNEKLHKSWRDSMGEFKERVQQSKQSEPLTNSTKEWEIVSFAEHLSGTWEKSGYIYPVINGMVGCFNNAMSVEEWLKNQPLIYSIHSVKRIADGEVFSIGDKISWGIHDSYVTTLLGFEMQDGRLKFNDSERPSHLKWADFLYSQNLHKKLPSPNTAIQETITTDNTNVLFTTEDGVDVLKYWGKTKVWILSTSNWIISEVSVDTSPFKGATGNEFKYFSKKEAAENYIIENKKLFSLQEIKQYVGIYSSDFCLEKFELSAKEKLKNNSTK